MADIFLKMSEENLTIKEKQMKVFVADDKI